MTALATVFQTLEGSTGEKWQHFFQKEAAPNLLKIVQHVLSIPVSNANVERVFSVMGNIWTDECNRLLVNTVRSELTIIFNLKYNCTEFKEVAMKNKHLLKTAQSEAKYKSRACNFSITELQPKAAVNT